MTEEFLRFPGPEPLIVLLRLVGAALLCGVIGYERERRDHAAGLRTNMLVGFAAAAFGLLAIGLIEEFDRDTIRIDPLRLVEAITSGVAFLAAGLIVFARGRVHGLTTGASVWLSAATGLAVGLGHWLIAVVAAAGGFVILSVVSRLETWLGIAGKRRYDHHDHDKHSRRHSPHEH